MTATGFVTRFDVPASVPPIERKLLHLDDLQVELEGATTPADTSVHVHNGRLRRWSASSTTARFPEAPVIKAAWYYGTEKHRRITPELMAERDVEELLEEEE